MIFDIVFCWAILFLVTVMIGLPFSDDVCNFVRNLNLKGDCQERKRREGLAVAVVYCFAPLWVFPAVAYVLWKYVLSEIPYVANAMIGGYVYNRRQRKEEKFNREIERLKEELARMGIDQNPSKTYKAIKELEAKLDGDLEEQIDGTLKACDWVDQQMAELKKELDEVGNGIIRLKNSDLQPQEKVL